MTTPEPVVMLPGTLCTGEVFAAQAAALREAGHDVQVLPLGPETHVDTHAATVLATAPERFALAGFSQGAITALAVLRRAPARVSRAAFLALNPGPATDAQREVWSTWLADAHSAAGRRHIGQALSANVGPASASNTALKARIANMAEATPGAAFEGQLAALASRPDAWDTLSDLKLPCALAVGTDDPVTTPELHERVLKHLPQGTNLTAIQGAGHYAPLERPEAVTCWLQAWLAGVSPAPGPGLG
jgi:pimeloyl-ACP methyl ester carboxylesterase